MQARKAQEDSALRKEPQVAKECWVGEMVFPTREYTNWLSSTKLSALTANL